VNSSDDLKHEAMLTLLSSLSPGLAAEIEERLAEYTESCYAVESLASKLESAQHNREGCAYALRNAIALATKGKL